MKHTSLLPALFPSTRGRQRLFKALYAFVCFLIALWSATFATPFFGTALPQHDTPATIYSSALQHDLRGSLTEAIYSAKRSVWLMVYSLSDRAILHALREAAAKGIDVHVIIDKAASPQAAKLLGSRVKTILRSAGGLMHLKILVIDEAQIWCGSANMTHDSLYLHHNLVLAMHHPELAQAILVHAKQLKRNTPSPHTPPLLFKLGNQQGEFWFLPQKAALQRLCDMLATAKKTVRVAMFTWTHPMLTDAVIAAHRRGVQVEVCVDRNQSSGSGAATVKRLCEAGIPVRTNYGNALLHHKCLWIDETLLACGSANWTRAAIKSNDDYFVVLSPLNSKQIASMHALWRDLRKETLRYASAYSPVFLGEGSVGPGVSLGYEVFTGSSGSVFPGSIFPELTSSAEGTGPLECNTGSAFGTPCVASAGASFCCSGLFLQ